MFFAVGHQVCTHLMTYFGPLLFTETLNLLGFSCCCSATSSVSSFHTFLPTEVRRLARSLHDLNVLLLPRLRVLNFTSHDPVHWPWCSEIVFYPQQLNSPKHNVSTSMLNCWDGVFWIMMSIPLPARELDFGFFWPEHFLPSLLWIV